MKVSIKGINSKPYLVNDSNSIRFDLTDGYEVFTANQFLKTLSTGVEIKFDSYSQYSNMLNEINEKLNDCN